MRPTAVTERLGMRHPLVRAPMAGGPSTPAVAAAVSEAGGLGSYGAAYLPLEKMREEIRAIRARTAKPFAVNLFADDGVAAAPPALRAAQAALAGIRAELGGTEKPAAPTPSLPQSFAVLLEEGGPGVSFTFRIPPPENLPLSP